MRVALFFDGKNFYSGYKDHGGGRVIDFVKLSKWLMDRVGGTIMTGAHYYTGIEPGAEGSSEKLTKFLDNLEVQSGYFVYRFPRKKRSIRCRACSDVATYTTEKEVDTTMVADMLRLAAVDAFDVLILLSGDSDHAPAIEGVRLLGKMAYVSTWGGSGLAARLRRAAFDHIDLKDGLGAFGRGAERTQQSIKFPRPEKILSTDDGALAFLVELEAAQLVFSKVHVGINYFLSKWESTTLKETPIIRRRILSRLVKEGKVELYDAPNGDKAMRIVKSEGATPKA
jgi:uncharacterized LabA/DUF88 family protein